MTLHIKVSPWRTPTSRRFCLVCGKYTIWRYNKELNHSKCGNCGSDSRMSRSQRPEGYVFGRNAQRRYNAIMKEKEGK